MIAMTGTTEWVSVSAIAPTNNAWKNWTKEATEHLTKPAEFDMNGKLTSPIWDCQKALTRHIEFSRPDDIIKEHKNTRTKLSSSNVEPELHQPSGLDSSSGLDEKHCGEGVNADTLEK